MRRSVIASGPHSFTSGVSMDIIKQVVGADLSKDTIDVHFGSITTEQEIQYHQAATFPNTSKGFIRFTCWIQKQRVSKTAPLWIVMEATGVYYENFAYYLHAQHYTVCVLLPNKVKHYAKTLDNKSKTDALDARTITQLGLERSLASWQPPSELMRTIKALTREYQAITALATQVQNQLHAKEFAYQSPKETVKRLRSQLHLFEQQLRSIEQELRRLVDQDPDLREKVARVKAIKGVGFLTVVSVVAETNGFVLFTSRKQLASYAGMDVVLRQSGKYSGKTTLSKKGNKHLRRAVFMPALAAIRCNKHLKEFYLRLVQRKSNKKIALLAVARKLLCLIYTIWKNGVPYDPNYHPSMKANIR
jgi:transposase